MAHLGSEVAAYVDQQLSGAKLREAQRHLGVCAKCRRAVRQQEVLKDRMRRTSIPDVPPELLATLGEVKDLPVGSDRSWSSIRRSVPMRRAVSALSAAALVVAAAYAIGPASPERADPIIPSYDDYVVAFADSEAGSGSAPGSDSATAVQAIQSVSHTALGELASDGWSCHERLGPHFWRTETALADNDDALMIGYSDGTRQAKLFEQRGSLDTANLHGFEPASIADSIAWVRPGTPAIVTWDGDGMVFTIVTDAPVEQWGAMVGELPMRQEAPSSFDRVGGGFTQMASWFGAA